MATDRDEQRRQQQELDEIRRSFAEMGARMGSLFEPAEAEEPEGATTPVLPPAPAVERGRPRWQLVGVALLLVLLGTFFGWAPPQSGGRAAPAVGRGRPRWRVGGVGVLLVVVGTLFGWALAQGGDDDAPPRAVTATTAP